MLNELQFFVLPGSHPPAQFQRHYESAFDCWSSVWRQTYGQDLKIDKQLFSDEFTRQTEIDAIFRGEQCIATLFLRYIDLALTATKYDSHFRIWTELDLRQLVRPGKKSIILASLAVDPEWRGPSAPIRIKDLLFYFVTRSFISSGAGSMAATTRRAKGVHDLCYKFGARSVRSEISHFNDEDKVDLVAFYQDTVTDGTDEQIKILGQKLWVSRTVVASEVGLLPSVEVLERAS